MSSVDFKANPSEQSAETCTDRKFNREISRDGWKIVQMKFVYSNESSKCQKNIVPL